MTSRQTTSRKTIATAAVTTGLLTVGGATYAFADGGSSASPATASPSSSASATPSSQPSGASAKDHRGSHHEHGEPATGTEASAVRAAIKVKYPTVSITHVDLEANGSYHAFGATSDGKRVVYDVSKDYRTVTLDTHVGARQGGPQQRWQQGTVVTGATAVRVKAAVLNAFPGVNILEVRQAPNGGYLAHATRGSEHLFIHVSKDLKTVDARAHEGQHS